MIDKYWIISESIIIYFFFTFKIKFLIAGVFAQVFFYIFNGGGGIGRYLLCGIVINAAQEELFVHPFGREETTDK